jgi:hypothetical protein
MVDVMRITALFLASMPTSTPSTTQLKRAVEISERIEQLQRELNSILGSSAPAASASVSAAPAPTAKRGRGRRKGNLSPEARERIAAAQRLRWAKAKGAAPAAAPAAPAAASKAGRKGRGGKRVISAEARAKMAEAARRRWAAVKKKK